MPSHILFKPPAAAAKTSAVTKPIQKGLLFFIIFWPQFLWSQSSSQSFEEKIHNIYKSSYSQEVPDDLWSQYVNNAGTRSYQVAEGDNLWTLSEVFFGDGHYWSKIWSYNEKLTNPHLILVGQKILFFTGSVEQPPSLSIENKKEGPSEEIQLSDGEENPFPTENNIAIMPQISIPPPKEKVTPVRPIPPAFKDSSQYDISKFDGQKLQMNMHSSIDHIFSIFVEAFLYDEGAKNYPKKIGRVLESEESKSLLGLNDFIYIESEESLNIGEELTVMDENYVVKGLILSFGSVINYLGRITIINPLGDNRYRAEVSQSFGEIKSGAWISRESIPSFFNDYRGQHSDIELDVIGGGGVDKEVTIFSQNDILFLNGGSEQGLKQGDILGIYSKRNKRYKNTRVKISPIPIAHVKVFNTSKTVASAFVLDSSEAILMGDKTGNPTFLAKSDSKNNFSKDLGIENPETESSPIEEDLGVETPETESPPTESSPIEEDLGVETPETESPPTESSPIEEDLGIENPETE